MSDAPDRNDETHRDLDDLTVAELVVLLADAETALQQIREELDERIAPDHQPGDTLSAEELNRLLPGPNLAAHQGRWLDFFRFFRDSLKNPSR